MKLLILQNSDFEKPGILTEWAKSRKIPFTIVRAYEENISGPEDFSHLILLGSPHSVSERPKLPWLEAEAKYAERFLGEGKHVLGICLGAQLLAQMLGGEISVGAWPEVGWHRVEETGTLPPAVLFQWHREIFSLPPGATAFGRSAATALQGFWMGERVLALAGHPEIDAGLVAEYIARCWSAEWFEAESAAGRAKFIQRPEEMTRETPRRLEESREAVFSWLDRWAGVNKDS